MQRADRPADVPMAFLSYSNRVQHTDASERAVECVRGELDNLGWKKYDWQRDHSTSPVDQAVREWLQESDFLILDATGISPNVAFEMGFAQAANLPVVTIKCQGAPELPADYGNLRYLEYPREANGPGFDEFSDGLRASLVALSQGKLSAGHRKLRRARWQVHGMVERILNGYNDDHAILHLVAGWAGELAREMTIGAPNHIRTDAVYYPASFAALSDWTGGRSQSKIHAVADLTDPTEEFWRPEHPRNMSTRLTERIFVVDWRWFFDQRDRLEEHVKRWRQALADQDYVISIADWEPAHDHPLGERAIGNHLLLIEPDAVGGYELSSGVGEQSRRLLYVERHPKKYNEGASFYQIILNRAVRFDRMDDAATLRRKWLAARRIGRWNPAWNKETENRVGYFDDYDKHIRCWIPNYSLMISECAALVEGEIARALQRRGESREQLSLLELGFGSGSLTSLVLEWVRNLNRPFEVLDDDPPVRRYEGWDRAPQMVRRVQPLGHASTTGGCQVALMRSIIWQPARRRYDVIFGSLIFHFMVDAKADAATMDEFFRECVRRLRPGGSLVLADVFPADDGDRRAAQQARWSEWMSGDGGGLEPSEVAAFLEGNQDMVNAPSPERVIKAASDHRLTCEADKAVSASDLPFRILVFRSPESESR